MRQIQMKKHDIEMWWRTTYKDGTFSIEKRFSPLQGSLVVKNKAFRTEEDAWSGRETKPLTKGFKACCFCKFFHRSEEFCAVNPSYAGNGTNCSERQERNKNK